MCENHADDGAIIALNTPHRIDENPVEREKSPYILDGTWKFLPTMVTSRLVAQDGLFTIHSNIECPMDKSVDIDAQFERIIIPSYLKKQLMYGLYRFGVHRASLFPDLEGLAKHIAWMQSVSPEWLK